LALEVSLLGPKNTRLTYGSQKVLSCMMLRCGMLLSLEPRSVMAIYRALVQIQWKQSNARLDGIDVRFTTQKEMSTRLEKNWEWDPTGVVCVVFERLCLQMLQLHLIWRYNREYPIELIAENLDVIGLLLTAVKADLGLDGRLHNRDL
jgi:hypothetical protein